MPKPYLLFLCDNEACDKHEHGNYYYGKLEFKCPSCKQQLSFVPNALDDYNNKDLNND